MTAEGCRVFSWADEHSLELAAIVICLVNILKNTELYPRKDGLL